MAAPEDVEALEEAAWARFVSGLKTHLADQWPAMPVRLGDRYEAFVDLAVQQALQRGFALPAAIARYANLWVRMGPAFHDKPGFEWAQGILAAPPAREWVITHQLVQRSLRELQRLPDVRIEPQALAQADALVIDTFGGLGRRGAMRLAEVPPPPRVACDLEGAELRLPDAETPLHEYRLVAGGEWQRVPAAVPPPLRVDAARPMPALLALLSPPLAEGRQTRLQARLRAHAACNGDVHPAIGFLGPHGRWSWHGHETRAVQWAVTTREQPGPAAGPGTLVAEETSPEIHQLFFETCGVRDEGDPLGPLKAMVHVWPSAQWWLEVQRAVPAAQSLLPGPRPWQRAATRCRLERDGSSQDSAPLKAQFEEGLDGALAVATQKLVAAWEQVPGLARPAVDALLGLLVGRAAFTWGWRHGPGGLDGPAIMRLVALLAMDACQAELQLTGELAVAGATSRFTLRTAGQQPLRAEIRREAPAPDLAEAVLVPATAEWRFPFTLAVEPLAADSAALLQQAGPVAGALVGRAGLRPNTHGGSGFEWYATLGIEAVSVPLLVADPLLGDARFVQPLLPALELLDWSMG